MDGQPPMTDIERARVAKQKEEIRRMKLTKEQLNLFRDTFVIFDKDGDGTIDSKELKTVLSAMGYNPTKEEVREMVDQVDADGSGSIEFLEFLLLMGRMIKDIPNDNDLRDIFVVFDKDRGGFVSSTELKYVMSQLGVHFTEEELMEMVIEADTNGDGQVDFNEFKAMMTAK